MGACIFFGLIITGIVLVLFFSSPDLPKISLASLNVTKLNNSTGDRLFSCLNMQFQVLNPNLGTNIYYNDVYCSVYHGKNRLASTVSPAFNQRAREKTQINVTVNLIPGTIARGIRNDLATYGFVKFDVKLTAVIKLLFQSSESVKISCDDVVVGLLPASGGNAKMIGPARMCRVS